MDIKQTKKIADELVKLGFKITGKDSNILWFGQKEYKGPQELRNKDKDLCRLRPYSVISFEAGVNPNGVGDGKKPDKDLTYAINFNVSGTIRLYRHKEFYECEHLKYYNYSRDLKELVKDFKEHLTKNCLI